MSTPICIPKHWPTHIHSHIGQQIALIMTYRSIKDAETKRELEVRANNVDIHNWWCVNQLDLDHGQVSQTLQCKQSPPLPLQVNKQQQPCTAMALWHGGTGYRPILPFSTTSIDTLEVLKFTCFMVMEIGSTQVQSKSAFVLGLLSPCLQNLHFS